MVGKSIEHPTILVPAQMQERRIMSDHAGKMRSNQRFIVEAEHRERNVISRVFGSGETGFKSLELTEFRQVLKGDADTCGYGERYVFDQFAVACHLTVGVTQEEAYAASAVDFLSQCGHERGLVQP